MIRVFRAANARELKRPPEDPPVVEAPIVDQVLANCIRAGLTPGEREAVQRALTQVRGARDTNILIAADGTIFRIERFERPTPAPVSRQRSLDWATTERGATVVVVHEDPAFASRLVSGLRFLGYAARAIERPTADALLTTGPAVVVASLRVIDEVLVAIDGSCALVALLMRGEIAPRGTHATLSRPLDLSRVASVLDPLIRHLKARPEIERASRQ